MNGNFSHCEICDGNHDIDQCRDLLALRAMACSGWLGKLVHDRSGYADWGWLRDEAGDLIIIVKPPPMTEEDENRHRRAGTDPAQARVDAVLAAINGQND
jgi:hypothetical protein